MNAPRPFYPTPPTPPTPSRASSAYQLGPYPSRELQRYAPPSMGQRFVGDAAPSPQAPSAGTEEPALTTLGDALKRITWPLLLVGAATGAAFALGSGLVHKIFFSED